MKKIESSALFDLNALSLIQIPAAQKDLKNNINTETETETSTNLNAQNLAAQLEKIHTHEMSLSGKMERQAYLTAVDRLKTEAEQAISKN